ncbi:MAG: CAP domain-containing protein [Candidatus Zambryskibacteria bacterium]|nr:CAP domain-containing protein [Candidatus Zambryskibacteria bacterium]
MINWFKRHFVPHEGNGHRPYFLHKKNATQLIGIVLFFELIFFVLPALNFVGFIHSLNLTAVLPGVLTSLTNEKRIDQSLPQLSENVILNQAAQLKAQDMASKSYFAHTSPEGRTPWYWLEAVGYTYTYAGENLAVNFVDSEDVTEAWMNSSTHRANIVHGAYTEVGTGVATGMYKGRQTVFVAQVYGRPRINPQPTTNPSTVLGASNPQPAPRAPAQPASVAQTQVTAQTPSTEVLGEAAPSVPAVSEEKPGINKVTQETVKDFFQTAAASPRHSTDAVLYSIMGIITLAILFNIFIKIKHQHPDLVLNGAVVMVVVMGLHLSNTYISQEQTLRTSFIAFEAEQMSE